MQHHAPPPLPMHHQIPLQTEHQPQSFVHSNINYHQNKYSIEMMNVGGDTIAHSSGSPAVTGAAAMADHQQMLRSSSSQSKMSDILKRKNAAKRKSQTATRSKSRNQDHHGEQSPSATSSVVQDLINKATALGKVCLFEKNINLKKMKSSFGNFSNRLFRT